MAANWSLILNILLLVGVIFAIAHLMKSRRESLNPVRYQPSARKVENSPYDTQPLLDDIIAVRKVNTDILFNTELPKEAEKIKSKVPPPVESHVNPAINEVPVEKKLPSKTIMIFLLAKENRQFAGYELLQTVLAAGLRFGEKHLFHRHQLPNGQGPILCSLASATTTGVFDLQNIGALSVRGLCLFMQASTDSTINTERFSVMLETARQLSEGLNAHLLDELRKPLTSECLNHYCKILNIKQGSLESAIPLE